MRAPKILTPKILIFVGWMACSASFFASASEKLDQNIDPHFDNDGVYTKTLELCEAPGTFKEFAHSTTLKTVRMVEFYWSGFKSGFTKSPFLLSPKLQALLNHPEYWHALSDCFGDNRLMQMSFTATLVVFDRTGHLSEWILTAKGLSVFIGVLSGTKFILAHPVLFQRIGYTLVGTTAVIALWQMIDSVQMIFHHYHEKRNLRKTLDDPKSLSQEEVDESLKIVMERIQEIDQELDQTLDPTKREYLLKNRAILKDLLDKGQMSRVVS